MHTSAIWRTLWPKVDKCISKWQGGILSTHSASPSASTRPRRASPRYALSTVSSLINDQLSSSSWCTCRCTCVHLLSL